MSGQFCQRRTAGRVDTSQPRVLRLSHLCVCVSLFLVLRLYICDHLFSDLYFSICSNRAIFATEWTQASWDSGPSFFLLFSAEIEQEIFLSMMRLPPIFILAGSIIATSFAESGEFNLDYFSSLFADWKPIASSRDTSYFDYFALDKSESSFAVKIPSRESLIGENNSREERGHRWSSQSQNPPVGSRKY